MILFISLLKLIPLKTVWHYQTNTVLLVRVYAKKHHLNEKS